MNRTIAGGILIILYVLCTTLLSTAQESPIANVTLFEEAGLQRTSEYVESTLQAGAEWLENENYLLVAIDAEKGDTIFCQLCDVFLSEDPGLAHFSAMFPVSLNAYERKQLELVFLRKGAVRSPKSDLSLRGKGFDLIVENDFYLADLTKSEDSEGKNHDSGQLRELLIKIGFDQLLTNSGNRVHWAPNFKREELEYYITIAHWETPREYSVQNGPWSIITKRRDLAPRHPEIVLSATYTFYADAPYFTFYSCMEMQEEIWLELLRNDEMTTDSMFTNLAFKRTDGEIVDVTYHKRHAILEERPIETDIEWICFYNSERDFAFGSIHLQYDNLNRDGIPSPTFNAHMQIGEWRDKKYWNRRLIHDNLTFIPKGSRYEELNAYLVFAARPENRFKEIEYWAKRLRAPVKVVVTHY